MSDTVECVMQQWMNAANNNVEIFAKSTKDELMEKIEEEYKDVAELLKNGVVRPWNYQDFLLRVRTFKPSSWFAKPRMISALQCARCGWTNTAPDVISCATCEVSLTHAADDISGKSLYALMTRAHKDHCGWRDNFSPVSFLSFPDTSLDTLTDNFVSRLQRILRLLENRQVLGNALTDIVIPDQLQQYQSIASVLCLHPNSTPHVAMTTSNHTSEMRRIYYRILELLATVKATPDTDAEVYMEELHRKRTFSDPHALISAGYTPPLSLRCAVLLALCGWNVRRVVEAATDTIPTSTSDEKRPSSPLALSQTSVQFLHCDLCDRCISIEMLVSSDKKPDTRIEPLLQHRFFCPWALPYIRPPPESVSISVCSNSSIGGDEERSDISGASSESIPIPPVPLSGYPGWLLTAEAIIISGLGYSDAQKVLENLAGFRIDECIQPMVASATDTAPSHAYKRIKHMLSSATEKR